MNILWSLFGVSTVLGPHVLRSDPVTFELLGKNDLFFPLFFFFLLFFSDLLMCRGSRTGMRVVVVVAIIVILLLWGTWITLIEPPTFAVLAGVSAALVLVIRFFSWTYLCGMQKA